MLTEICQINCEDIENSLSVELAFIYLAAPPLFPHCTEDDEHCLFNKRDEVWALFCFNVFSVLWESGNECYLNISKYCQTLLQLLLYPRTDYHCRGTDLIMNSLLFLTFIFTSLEVRWNTIELKWSKQRKTFQLLQQRSSLPPTLSRSRFTGIDHWQITLTNWINND